MRGTGPRPEWLCLDFNCAMYAVLRNYAKERPWTVTAATAWESGLCDAIADYMGELIGLAQPTKGVYVSCDGVVCAAKRKQQRLRRFKGPWASAQEMAIRKANGETLDMGERWDQNALTPGSTFMARLGDCLVTAGARFQGRYGVSVTVSTTAEPGEGEHKLLRHMRAVRPASCTIYGLDADLILLAMLLWTDTGAEVRLLREAQEFESRSGADEWRTLTINGLKDVLVPGATVCRVRDFVAAMTLLGNDFLPRSLTKTVRDDGIPALLATLNTAVWSTGATLINAATGKLDRAALLAVLRAWAATEDADMLVSAIEARKAAVRPAGIGATPGETALRTWNAQPAAWATLAQLLTSDGSRLKPDWRRIYRETWRAGDATAYVQGLAWVWDYYMGLPVDQGWHYEAHLPPLWSDVVAALEAEGTSIVTPPAIHFPEPLPAWLHLLSVLPATSVRALLPTHTHKHLDASPHFWPAGWSLFDVGRTQMWECEPVIPVIPERVLRSWDHTLK